MELSVHLSGHNYSIKENIIGTSIVFMYIFSFYVLGPVTSSIVAAIIVFPTCFKNKRSRFILQELFFSQYYVTIIGFLLLLISLCVFYSTIHLTHDFSYLKTLIGQSIQIISGGFIIAYFIIKYTINFNKILNWVIIAFIIQSFIELIAVSLPSIAAALDYFNHAGEDQEKSGGVRGMALSSGTTWSLALVYGIALIIYFGYILSYRISLKTTLGLLILLIGTIFAGRTGFVGAVFGGIYFLIFGKTNILQKSLLLGYIIIIICCIVILVYIFAPQFVEYMIFNVMPWAFEPILNLIDHGELSTGSTDKLDEMWNEIPTVDEAIFGVGLFTGPDGKYYRHTDVGILRNLFYWGIGGYLVLIAYHIYLMWPVFKIKTYRILWIFVLLYLFLCEYKAMTLGYNKLTISIIFLISSVAYINRRNLFKNI